MIKNLKVTFDRFVGLGVWVSALALAILMGVTAWHLLLASSATVYHLMHS